jgi:hypothetical protein
LGTGLGALYQSHKRNFLKHYDVAIVRLVYIYCRKSVNECEDIAVAVALMNGHGSGNHGEMGVRSYILKISSFRLTFES